MGTNWNYCVKCGELTYKVIYDLDGYGPLCQECYILYVMKKLEEFLKREEK